MSLALLSQSQLDDWVAQARSLTSKGHLPDYIPQLAQANPHTLAIQVQTVEGRCFVSGDTAQPLALMSVVKPFLLLFALEQWGAEAVFRHVGMQPSDQPFHSVAQLTLDQGFPRNPMINSGAIALTSFVSGDSGKTRCETFRQWLNTQAQTQLVVNQMMLHSVRSLTNETNRTIARLLQKATHLDQLETAIDTYNHICCLSGTLADLAHLGLLLAHSNAIAAQHQRTVNALMLTCGLYEVSGALAVRIGLPMKSGVSGALLAIVPRQGAIACYSPAIDQTGNSVAGLFLVETLVQALNLSVFS
ncbi:glutaminase A [Myxacorys almedinensis]|uniref:Glutaminase n=1 Tax=Myxacorys almedinensis A TaxID=2690445 RepID=A0A8J7Z2R5_9CYAN|nr:glutaminase A [Myxacorys almedinensis]NDJ19302.1 glutaminase A [Myxacorys almedinensis A]